MICQVQNWYNGTVHCPGVALTTRGVANGDSVQMQTNNTRFKAVPKSVPLSAKPIYPNTIVIPLTKGCVMLVDAEDFPLVGHINWYAEPSQHTTYARSKVGHVHRYILTPGAGLIVDHINGDALDNRRCNLRVGTYRQNAANIRNPKSSVAFGVCKKGNLFMAELAKKRLGYYKTVDEAVAAFAKAHIAEYGEWSPYYNTHAEQPQLGGMS